VCGRRSDIESMIKTGLMLIEGGEREKGLAWLERVYRESRDLEFISILAEASREDLCSESSPEYTREAARDGDVRSVLILAQAMTSDGGEWGPEIVDVVAGVRLFLSVSQARLLEVLFMMSYRGKQLSREMQHVVMVKNSISWKPRIKLICKTMRRKMRRLS
jgi:hypothetical protein